MEEGGGRATALQGSRGLLGRRGLFCIGRPECRELSCRQFDLMRPLIVARIAAVIIHRIPGPCAGDGDGVGTKVDADDFFHHDGASVTKIA